MRYLQTLHWITWNIFLSLIPVALAYTMVWLCRSAHARFGALSKFGLVVVGAVWLFFLPNTCYLVTEWRHFLEVLGGTSLLDAWVHDSASRLILISLTLFYMVYSGVGILTFTLATRPIVRMIKKSDSVRLWVVGIPFFLMMSLGVYLGLVQRFNTWDMLDEMGSIWNTIIDVLTRPSLSAFIILFAGFLWIVYMFMDIWVDGFVSRYRQKLP